MISLIVIVFQNHPFLQPLDASEIIEGPNSVNVTPKTGTASNKPLALPLALEPVAVAMLLLLLQESSVTSFKSHDGAHFLLLEERIY
jgi:hypothetical protein